MDVTQWYRIKYETYVYLYDVELVLIIGSKPIYLATFLI